MFEIITIVSKYLQMKSRNRPGKHAQPQSHPPRPAPRYGWKCRECQAVNEPQEPCCVPCYWRLCYQQYIRMHMFVQSDD